MPKNSSLVLATEREVKNAKPGGQRTEFRIKGARNLVLRVTPSGTKSWAFLYASPGSGQRRKLSIGTYPARGLAEAKIEALRLTLAVQAGKDPIHEQEAERAADTFSSLARKYIDEHSKKFARGSRRSPATNEAERILRIDILPTIGRHRAESVTRRHVMDVVEAVASRGAYVAADRVLTIIRAIYNWANSTGRLEVNPTLGLKKRNASPARERVLSDDEIRSLWDALERPSGSQAPPPREPQDGAAPVAAQDCRRTCGARPSKRARGAIQCQVCASDAGAVSLEVTHSSPPMKTVSSKGLRPNTSSGLKLDGGSILRTVGLRKRYGGTGRL